jgi:hypothetical protein
VVKALVVPLLVPYAQYGFGNDPDYEQENPKFHGASEEKKR